MRSHYAKAAVACAGGVLQTLTLTLGADTAAGRLVAVLLALGTAYGVWRVPNAAPPTVPLPPLH
jgi:hypothetical protein